MKENKSKYVLLLNNDTVVDKEFLSELVKVGETDDKVGIIGPKMYYYNYNGRKDVIWFGGGKINQFFYPGYFEVNKRKIDNFEDNNVFSETDWISGACILINIRKINPLLNQKFFFGCEDIDLCLEVKKKGFRIIYCPNSIIWHKVGCSRKKSSLSKIKEVKTNFYFVYKDFMLWPLLYPLYIVELFVRLIKKLFKK
jgi:GT2 family glycosyltransferase